MGHSPKETGRQHGTPCGIPGYSMVHPVVYLLGGVYASLVYIYPGTMVGILLLYLLVPWWGSLLLCLPVSWWVYTSLYISTYTTLGTPSRLFPLSSSLLAGCTLRDDEALGSSLGYSLGNEAKRASLSPSCERRAGTLRIVTPLSRVRVVKDWIDEGSMPI